MLKTCPLPIEKKEPSVIKACHHLRLLGLMADRKLPLCDPGEVSK